MKQPIKIATVKVSHYFRPVLEHWLPPSLNLNHNAYTIFPRIHVGRENMARSTKVYFSLAKAQWMDFKEAEKWTFKSKIWKPKISFFVIKKP